MSSRVTGGARFADPAVGRPGLRFEDARVKGNLVRSRGRYVRETYGDLAFAALNDQVAGEALRYLRADTIMANAWYDYEPLVTLDLAILRGPMQGDLEQMRVFGRVIAGYDLKSVYKLLFRIGNPGFIFARVPLIYSLHFAPGKMVSVDAHRHEGRIRLSGAHPRYMCAYGMTGWLESALIMSKARDIAVAHSCCQHDGETACEWTATWQ